MIRAAQDIEVIKHHAKASVERAALCCALPVATVFVMDDLVQRGKPLFADRTSSGSHFPRDT